jgi:hypothetical protein
MARSRAIIPRRLSVDPEAMARVITNTLNATALAIKVDFEVTAQTWRDRPNFTIESPTPYEREIGTSDENYGRLNKGTRPHLIVPRRGRVLVFNTPFQSKTLPRQIASGPGRRGNVRVTTRRVHHPGTRAREWDTVIAQKWDRQVGRIFQQAVDAEVS